MKIIHTDRTLIDSQHKRIADLEAKLAARDWQPVRGHSEIDCGTDYSNIPLLFGFLHMGETEYIYADSVDDEGNIWHNKMHVGYLADAYEYCVLPLRPKSENT